MLHLKYGVIHITKYNRSLIFEKKKKRNIFGIISSETKRKIARSKEKKYHFEREHGVRKRRVVL